MHRFLCPIDDVPNLYHQVIHVLRMRVGDRFVVFGPDDVADTVVEITDIDNKGKDFEVQVVDSRDSVRNTDLNLTLFVAVPKKPALTEEIVQKMTEVGVSHIRPFRSSHSEFKGTFNMQRIDRIITESTEQSGRTRLLTFDATAVSFDQLLSEMQASLSDGSLDVCFVAHTLPHVAGQTDPQLHTWDNLPSSVKSAGLLIGPEGGFNDDEIVQLLDAGARVISLPGPVMRVSTACVALTSVLLDRLQ